MTPTWTTNLDGSLACSACDLASFQVGLHCACPLPTEASEDDAPPEPKPSLVPEADELRGVLSEIAQMAIDAVNTIAKAKNSRAVGKAQSVLKALDIARKAAESAYSAWKERELHADTERLEKLARERKNGVQSRRAQLYDEQPKNAGRREGDK